MKVGLLIFPSCRNVLLCLEQCNFRSSEVVLIHKRKQTDTGSEKTYFEPWK